MPQSGGGIGGLGGLIGSAFGLGTGNPAGATSTNIWTVKAANGAVWRGGFSPIAAFANGSPRIDRPTLGWVGEGRYNEAVIPLPDGRSVPVVMRGSGYSDDRPEPHIILVDNRQAAEAEAARLRAAGDTVRIVEARLNKEAGRASRGQSPFAPKRPPR